MSDNLSIWNTLGKTDPSHTKGFSRAGGFKGTAVKPVYTEQKMTETFGPCGIGWGFSEPSFQLVPGSDGQTAVYCWLTLWYVHEGARSSPIPGVGGDMVIVKQSSGLRTDDEAFKKAFTDAIGNAMKHIGMSADVHMGRFDDSKYVQELRDEARQESLSAPMTGRSAPAAVSRTSGAGATLSDVASFLGEMRDNTSSRDLINWSTSREIMTRYNKLDRKDRDTIDAAYNKLLSELDQREAA